MLKLLIKGQEIKVSTKYPLNTTIVLHVNHELQIPAELDIATSTDLVIKSPLSPLLEIMPASDLCLELHATIDNQVLPAEQFQNCALLSHLKSFLDRNLDVLGLQRTADYIVERDAVKMDLLLHRMEGFHSQSKWKRMPTLRRITLKYRLILPARVAPTHSSNALNPFEHAMTLPYLDVCNRLCTEFVKKHLTRRYPRIFSCYSETALTLAPFWTNISKSIEKITSRSRSSQFRNEVQAKIMQLQETMAAEERHLTSLLHSKIPALREAFAARPPESLSGSCAIESALEELYRFKFKPSAKLQLNICTDDSCIPEELCNEDPPTSHLKSLTEPELCYLADSPDSVTFSDPMLHMDDVGRDVICEETNNVDLQPLPDTHDSTFDLHLVAECDDDVNFGFDYDIDYTDYSTRPDSEDPIEMLET